jgi:TRAP-type C4-dicarboxylate transport system substrate-binding protein
MTKKAWKKVPAGERQKVKDIVHKFGQKIIDQARSDNDAAFKKMTGSGGGFQETPISDAKYGELKKVGMDAWAKLAKSIDGGAYLPKARSAVGK